MRRQIGNAAHLTMQNTKLRFTIEEDTKLREAVRLYGTNNWVAVAKYVTKRNPRQVKSRYINHADPSLDKSDLRPEEVEKLIQLRAVHGNNWGTISLYLPNRAPDYIKNYCNRRFHIATLNRNRISEEQKSSSQTHTSTITNALPNSCCSETIDSRESSEYTISTDIETPNRIDPILGPDPQDFYEIFKSDEECNIK